MGGAARSFEVVVREVLLREVAEAPRTSEQANQVGEVDSKINITTIEVAEVAEVDVSAGETMTSLNATVMPQSTFVQTGP